MEKEQLHPDFTRQWETISHGTLEITPEEEFRHLLNEALKEERPLRIKYGIDPTASDIHIGHMVAVRKMRQFQDLGHIGVVVVGDYTARIGDPTGKNESRPALSEEDVKKNAESYIEQLYKVLNPEKTEVHFQSEWFAKTTLQEILQWAAQTTVAKLLGHDTFAKRVREQQSLGLHELFYPVLQGVDSLYLNSDVELGGSDQRFNVLMGRDYQKYKGQRQQAAVLLPLIMGTCGKEKMSKSLGNSIGVIDEPFDQFGKVMSIPDDLMKNYATYAANFTPQEAQKFCELLQSGVLHPNVAKKDLAQSIVTLYHGEDIALQMKDKFEQVFAQKKVPDDIPEFALEGEIPLLDCLLDAQLIASKGEGRRLIKQGGIRFDSGDKITDPLLVLGEDSREKIIKVGKRKFLKIL